MAYYRYTSPRFREACKSGDYVTTTGTAMLLLRSFIGVLEDARIEARLDKAVITGDDTGLVYSSILIDGELLEFTDDKGSTWVFMDGQWWEEPEEARRASGSST